MKLTPGVDFTNISRTAFRCADPKYAKDTVKQSVFFALLGSASVKTGCKTLWNWPQVTFSTNEDDDGDECTTSEKQDRFDENGFACKTVISNLVNELCYNELMQQ